MQFYLNEVSFFFSLKALMLGFLEWEAPKSQSSKSSQLSPDLKTVWPQRLRAPLWPSVLTDFCGEKGRATKVLNYLRFAQAIGHQVSQFSATLPFTIACPLRTGHALRNASTGNCHCADIIECTYKNLGALLHHAALNSQATNVFQMYYTEYCWELWGMVTTCVSRHT